MSFISVSNHTKEYFVLLTFIIALESNVLQSLEQHHNLIQGLYFMDIKYYFEQL